MKILSVHPGSDTAGQSMASKPVLEAAGDEVRVFVGSHHIFGYPEAPIFNAEEVHEAYRWADVVLIHNDPGMFAKVVNGPRRPEVILYHHGSRFRTHPERLWALGESIGARQIVSTVDLLLSVPPGKEARWHGQLVSMDKMAAIREANRPDGDRLRVSHAPTNRAIKGTRYVRRALSTLDADLVLIQHQKWERCLALKAGSSIFVDQLKLGYGNNAIEAWAMGLPVIAGASEDILARMRKEYRGPIPFYGANKDTVREAIRQMLESEELRAEWADRGMRHVQKFHAPEAWVKRAHRIYAGDSSKADEAA